MSVLASSNGMIAAAGIAFQRPIGQDMVTSLTVVTLFYMVASVILRI